MYFPKSFSSTRSRWSLSTKHSNFRSSGIQMWIRECIFPNLSHPPDPGGLYQPNIPISDLLESRCGLENVFSQIFLIHQIQRSKLDQSGPLRSKFILIFLRLIYKFLLRFQRSPLIYKFTQSRDLVHNSDLWTRLSNSCSHHPRWNLCV